MIKSILVPMDDSKNSFAALKVASEISRLSQAKLKGLYVEDISRLMVWQPTSLAGTVIGANPDIPSTLPTEVQVEVEKEFLEEGARVKKHFKKACVNSELEDYECKAEFDVRRGEVDKVIVEESSKCDIVVMGRRGKTFPEDAPEPGPAAENVVRETARPVIIVPPKTRRTTRILIAYDGSLASQRSLATAASFAALDSTKVSVVTVSNNEKFVDKVQGEAREFLDNHGIEALYVSVQNCLKPWEGILRQAKEFDAGLIAMGAYGENKFKEFMFGSTTKHILMKSDCPVLLTR